MILVDVDEAEKILNNDRTMSIDLAEHDAKIRADAIDELTEAFDKWIKSTPKTSYYWTEFQVAFMKISEQIKEK